MKRKKGNTRKRKRSSSSRRSYSYPRKKRRKRAKKDKDIIEDEYDLQKSYNKWYTGSYPYVVSCGTPYANMSIFQAAKAKAKGYIKGFPDYAEYDPRLIIEYNNDYIRIKFIPGRFIEFKTPKGTGVVSKEQVLVLKGLKRRGYSTEVLNDYQMSKKRTRFYKKGFPYYNGWITINKKDFKIRLPRSSPKIILPGRKVKKTKTRLTTGRSKRVHTIKSTNITTRRRRRRRKRKQVKRRKNVKF